MVKKKFSGQTITIIILAVLLVLAIGFGGVYAFYSAKTSKVSGNVYMATLNIEMDTGSEKSEITISNAVNIVPGQPLYNTPLKINNKSSEEIEVYIIVVYRVNASVDVKISEDETISKNIVDKYEKPVLGLGYEYINSIDSSENRTDGVITNDWIDYVFDAPEQDTQYRVLVSMVTFGPTIFDKDGIPDPKTQITVIGENQLTLSKAMGNDYQGAHISFTFQAFAIGQGSFITEITPQTTKQQKAEIITRGIYESQDCSFLNIG